MRLIDADALFAEIKERHDMFVDCEYIGDKARRDELGSFMADIVNAPTIGGWISVKDRLPEDETVVIAYVQHKIGWYRMFAWHDMYGWHSSALEFDDKESDYVTHWMPLPEPPKEEAT